MVEMALHATKSDPSLQLARVVHKAVSQDGLGYRLRSGGWGDSKTGGLLLVIRVGVIYGENKQMADQSKQRLKFGRRALIGWCLRRLRQFGRYFDVEMHKATAPLIGGLFGIRWAKPFLFAACDDEAIEPNSRCTHAKRHTLIPEVNFL